MSPEIGGILIGISFQQAAYWIMYFTMPDITAAMHIIGSVVVGSVIGFIVSGMIGFIVSGMIFP